MSKPPILRKRGTFRLPSWFIVKEPDLAKAVLSGVVVVRAELLFMTDEICYDGMHDDFDEVPEEMSPPEYDAQVDDDGLVTWVRRE